jgi:acetyl esterase
MSPGILRRLVGPAPRNDRGVALDLQTQVLLRLAAFDRPLRRQVGVGLLRQDFERQVPLVDVPPLPLHHIEERFVAGPGGPVRVRIYHPGPRARAPRPICVYFHGGGFVLGSLASHDAICRYLAAWTDAIVVSVDYRLAPEHRFPAATHDAIAAFRWVAAHAADFGGDPARIAVAGDSAGGNLAAVVACHERDAAARPIFQLLVYPATDLTRSHPSHRTFARGFLLESESIDFFLEQYLDDPPRQVRDPMGSPLFWPDLRGVAPACVVVAGFDPLRDEGEAFARRLADAGVPVELRKEESLVHGFFCMGGVIDAARRAVQAAAESLALGLHGGGREHGAKYAAGLDVVH